MQTRTKAGAGTQCATQRLIIGRDRRVAGSGWVVRQGRAMGGEAGSATGTQMTEEHIDLKGHSKLRQ